MRVNDITHKDAYPLPNIEGSFDHLAGAEYFSGLNLASDFWQVEMALDDMEKTAFVWKHMKQGLYQFKVHSRGRWKQSFVECCGLGSASILSVSA
jgi:hypothetical protein